MSTFDHMLEPKAVRRVEVITGTGGRCRFSDDEKARIIEETLVPGAVVSVVARQRSCGASISDVQSLLDQLNPRPM